MIRTIITPIQNSISIDLPDNYLGKKVEVIAFPLDEEMEKSPKKTLADFWGVISKERAAAWIKEVEQSREEW
jgi:hypothetical protein